MATAGTSLILYCKDAGEKSFNLTFNRYIDKDADDTDISAFITAVKTNKALWTRQPVDIESAEMVETVITEVTVS